MTKQEIEAKIDKILKGKEPGLITWYEFPVAKLSKPYLLKFIEMLLLNKEQEDKNG